MIEQFNLFRDFITFNISNVFFSFILKRLLLKWQNQLQGKLIIYFIANKKIRILIQRL